MIDIVIVNWNSGGQLRDCLDSIRAHGGGAVASVCVVDNGSTDGSDDACTGDPASGIVRARQNLGFARACNLGAARGSAPYILFLNPDARLMEGTLSTVLGFMEGPGAAGTGICGVRLVGDGGQTHRHCARFPDWRSLVGKSLGLEGAGLPFFPAVHLREFDHLSSRFVDHTMGAFYFVRREVFAALGGFDERFFVYLEDLDFSLRASRAGWRTWYLAEATAFHKGGGSSEQVRDVRLFYSLRSRILYARKHFPRGKAAAVAAFALFVEPLPRLGRALLRASAREAGETVRGYGMLWKWARDGLRGDRAGTG
ncbi:MAG TPA: glycosyltransferase family 2 protein [Rhizomicrobium sp.]|jgi:GT2 family glycosyltransferase|nr:glycosyltransferase family 2 protein [Rhizomicrobium sp.]